MQAAAIYARYSSDLQRSESIEAQLKVCKDHAHKNNYYIVETYTDEALTGKNDRRPGFQKMLADAKIGKFSILLVHKTNRFGRNKDEISYFKYVLKKAGVKTVFVAEDFGDGHHAVILESMMEGMAEFYSLELATETMKGLLTNAEKCKYNGGRVLYGYRVNGEQLYEVNGQEAAVVKEIFERVCEGDSYSEIIDSLYRRGITRRGKPWHRHSMYELLRNEKYTGVYTFNKTPRWSGQGDVRNWRQKKDNSEVVRVEGGMPQIVSRELFDKVQTILEGRKQKPRGDIHNRKHVYLLTGLMVCGECGAPYVGSNRRTRDKDYPYYICTGRKKEKSCHNISLNKEKIELEAMEYIRQKLQLLDDDNKLQQIADAYNQIIDEQSLASSEELQSLQDQEKRIEARIDNLLEAIEAGGSQIGELTDRLKTMSSEKEQIGARRRVLENDIEASKITVDDVRSVLNSFDVNPDDEPENLKKQLHKLIYKIVVKPCGTAELEDKIGVLPGEGSPPRHQHREATLIEEIFSYHKN